MKLAFMASFLDCSVNCEQISGMVFVTPEARK
jgi:hypothetical protein